MRRWSKALAVALALASPASRALAAPRLVAVFDDPVDDDFGPGNYQYPGDTDFAPGDFDLRRFAVYVDGDDVIFEVTLGASFREPPTTQRTNEIPLMLLNGIYFQNIDIYVDNAPGSTDGFTACIPGRRVTFADGRTWKAAVVLTPQPVPARDITAKALGVEAASKITFAEGLVVHGRTVSARVPAYAVGGEPQRTWGYSVHVSGASWERSFSALELIKGGAELNAFTMPVVGMRTAWAFGGAPWGEAHPRVIDVLLPPGADQKAVLGSFNAEAGTFARVPFVYAVAPPPLPAPVSAPASTAAPPVDGAREAAEVAASAGPAPVAAPAGKAPVSAPEAKAPASSEANGPVLKVTDVAGDIVSVTGPVAGLRPMQLGRVVGPNGATVARLVIVHVYEGGLVGSAVEGRENVKRGALVRFDGAAP